MCAVSLCSDVPNSEPSVKYLNNHLRLIIFHHVESATGSRVVGFEVEAYSVQHKLADGKEWYEPKPDEYKDPAGYLDIIRSKNKLGTCNPGPGP